MVKNLILKTERGVTLVELMVVVAIIGVMATVGPDLYKQVRRFFFLSNTRVELQRDARASMYLITRQLRQAKSNTIVITRETGQPYYSKITFTDIDGRQVVFYQTGKDLYMAVNSQVSKVCSNLRYLAFAFPRSDDMGIISVALTVEKTMYEARTKALHMASEKVRVMN